jgi:hypothetical protein
MIHVPNVFYNVGTSVNQWIDTNGGAASVTPAQYTVTDYITAFNAASATITLTQDPVDGRLVATPTIIGDWVMSVDMVNLLGYTSNAVILGDVATVTFPTLDPIQALSIPNFGGVKTVLVHCDKMAPGNMVHAKTGQPHDIAAFVSFHNINYGQIGHFSAVDHVMGDIIYKDTNQLDTMTIEITDGDLRPLTLPINYNIEMIFKVFHIDNNINAKGSRYREG